MTHQITLSSDTLKHLMQITGHLLKGTQEAKEKFCEQNPDLSLSDTFIVDFCDSLKEFRREVIKNVHHAHWLEFDAENGV